MFVVGSGICTNAIETIRPRVNCFSTNIELEEFTRDGTAHVTGAPIVGSLNTPRSRETLDAVEEICDRNRTQAGKTGLG